MGCSCGAARRGNGLRAGAGGFWAACPIGAYLPPPPYGFEIELRSVFIKISYRCRREPGRWRLFRAYDIAPSSALEIIRDVAQIDAVRDRFRHAPMTGADLLPKKPDGTVPMSATTHAAKNSTFLPNFALRAVLRWVSATIEAHARYRVRSAMSPSQCQQVDREIRRYRRVMHAHH